MRESGIRTTVLRAFVIVFASILIGLWYSVYIRYTGPPQLPLGVITQTGSGNKSFRSSPIQAARKTAIAEAFQHAWNGYSKHCFGHDELKPVSNTCEDDFGGYGATAIDSISTAMLLGKEDVVVQILKHFATVDFKEVKGSDSIGVFEVTIRQLAGLISAWDLLHGPYSDMAKDPELRKALYQQIVTLGDTLSCAFLDSESGVPHGRVEPATCRAVPSTRTAVAGVGTLILEFARLSAITKNETHVQLARRAEEYLLNPKPQNGEPYPGLIGSFVSVSSGDVQGSSGSWGAFSDSFYEYLLKAYMYDNSIYGHYLDRWSLAVDSTIRSIGNHPYGHPEWTMLPLWNGNRLTNRMESLSWFAGGNIILGGMVTKNKTLVNYGLSIADAAGATYKMTTTGLGGEFVSWTTNCDSDDRDDCDPEDSIKLADGRYKLRPEVLETWYYAWRATKDEKYRDWTWSAFQAINRVCRTESGFSAISDVNAEDGGDKTDKQETFVFAEVFKYLYMTHAEDHDVPFHVQDSRTGTGNTWILNTEAHPFNVAGTPQ